MLRLDGVKIDLYAMQFNLISNTSFRHAMEIKTFWNVSYDSPVIYSHEYARMLYSKNTSLFIDKN